MSQQMSDLGILSPHAELDDATAQVLRPQSLAQFIGQDDLKTNLKVYIDAAKIRKQPLDHVLFYGPPGLGKTTLAQIIARELGTNIRIITGPSVSKAGDLASLLTSLQPMDVLFIDEIHRLSVNIEEVLYPAMEDGVIDIMIGEGVAARSVRLDLPPFTLVAATTRTGLLSNPLRDRFGIQLRLEFYKPEQLRPIIANAAVKLNFKLAPDATKLIAERCRGTPRIALRLVKRVADFALVSGAAEADSNLVAATLQKLGVDNMGLNRNDHRYLNLILNSYNGGPVGVETIAAALAEQRDTIEEVIEPYLLQLGLIARTPRGRVLSERGKNYF